MSGQCLKVAENNGEITIPARSAGMVISPLFFDDL